MLIQPYCLIACSGIVSQSHPQPTFHCCQLSPLARGKPFFALKDNEKILKASSQLVIIAQKDKSTKYLIRIVCLSSRQSASPIQRLEMKSWRRSTRLLLRQRNSSLKRVRLREETAVLIQDSDSKCSSILIDLQTVFQCCILRPVLVFQWTPSVSTMKLRFLQRL